MRESNCAAEFNVGMSCFDRLLSTHPRVTLITDMRRYVTVMTPLHRAKCCGDQTVQKTNTWTAQAMAEQKPSIHTGGETEKEVRGETLGHIDHLIRGTDLRLILMPRSTTQILPQS